MEDNEQFQGRLDGIEEVRCLLEQKISGGFSKAFYANILESVTHLVVVGTHTPAKNAILSRITLGKVSIPHATQNVAINIEMRRGDENVVTVMVRENGGSGSGNREEEIAIVNGDVTLAIKQALDTVIFRSGKVFSDEKTILVSVKGPDVPNLTVVCLPGLTSSNLPDDNLTVKNTVIHYSGMQNTLILLVIKGDENIDKQVDSLPPTVKEIRNTKSIVLITHCDMLDKLDSRKVETRLRNIIAKSSGPRYAILSAGEVWLEVRI